MAEPPQTALIHFYRGELGRMAIYRVRLDTTTNWAIGVSVAVGTFALGNPAAPHITFAVPYLLTLVFLYIEARRFQELEVFRGRVRALEVGYFAPAFRGEERGVEWAEELAASLENPEPRVTLGAALAHRARRNYTWLFLVIYGSWWLKLWLAGGPVVQGAAVGELPGLAVIVLATVMVLPWLLLALRTHKAGLA